MRGRLFEFEERGEGGAYGRPSIFHATSLSAGFDLASAEEVAIAPGEWRAVDTGLRIRSAALPEEFSLGPGLLVKFIPELQIRPRSGLALRHGVTVLNAPGTVDADFRGPIRVLLVNHGRETFLVKKGDRIAQAVVALVTVGADVNGSERGEGGFGSSGV